MSERLETLRAMLEDDPEDAFTRYAMAMELKGLGRAEEALTELSDLVARQPDYVAAYYQLGGLLLAQARSEDAAGVVRRGIEVAARAGDRHAQRELEDLLADVEG